MAKSRAFIKNALRTYFNYKGQKNKTQRAKDFHWKEFQKIRASTDPSDYSDLYQIVENNKHYPFSGLGNSFPEDKARLPDSRLRSIDALPLRKELDIQFARILHHKDAVIRAVASIDGISRSLADGSFAETKTLIDQHRIEFGESLILAKKEFLLSLETGGPQRTRLLQTQLTSGFANTGWAVLINYVYDNVDPAFEVGNANRVWQRLAKRWGDRNSWILNIVVGDSLTVPRNTRLGAEYLLRMNALSLLDLTMVVWKMVCICPNDDVINSKTYHRFPIEFIKIVEYLSDIRPRIPNAYSKRQSGFVDSEVYRTSFFFDEYRNVGCWRFEINKLMTPDFDSKPGSIIPLHLALAGSIESLTSDPDDDDNAFQRFSDWTSPVLPVGSQLKRSNFFLSLSVARVILENPDVNPSTLITLLSKAPECVDYVSIESARRLLDEPATLDHRLASFMVWDVLYKKDRNQDHELERRSAFMAMLEGKSHPDIVPFIESVYIWSPPTALTLVAACSRSFLEKLYLLMTSVQDVIESRLAICLWAEAKGITVGSMIEERKALERELANLDARSDLDSTRIHVDEEYLREWFVETQKPIVNRYIQTALSEGADRLSESILSYYLKQRESTAEGVTEVLSETQVGADFILVRIFDQTLITFATDKNFGLDSYLSRRIRHGTLSGNIVTPIGRIVRKLNDAVVESDLPSSEADHVISRMAQWEANLGVELDRLRSSIIQIRTEQAPEGLIRATWKRTTNLTHLDAMVSRVKSRIIASNGEYDFFVDIHSLCWDCIEPDLANLRLHMTRVFLPIVVNSLREIFEENTTDTNRFLYPFFAQIENTLQARVQEICGWFIRPVFRRDEYDLLTLVNSSFSIIKDLDVDYEFNEVVKCGPDVSLNRGGFEVLGDVLFVLIGNAARHGQKDGDIIVEARPIGGTDNVLLIVESTVKDAEHFALSVSRAKAALSDSFINTSNAAVQEGFSGLKKLRSLIYRLRSEEYHISLHVDESQLKFVFTATLPVFVTFKRERT
ncbi:hypothetical protein [Methylorubrum extorquens]